jgi:sigma-B regulation protein RsbU (phosphoserine phosphatase)
MDLSIWGILLRLLEQACLVIVVFYLLFQVKFFRRMLDGKPNLLDQLILAIIFGALAVYGTYSGVQTSGAIANIRNLGPMIGGFLGGPLAGLGAGLIGGIHRYYMGGFTAVPCALGTITSGLAAGIIYTLLKGNLGIWKPTLYAFALECADMGLLLLMAQPFEKAVNLVAVIAAPMILADTAGMAIFAFVLGKLKSAR